MSIIDKMNKTGLYWIILDQYEPKSCVYPQF